MEVALFEVDVAVAVDGEVERSIEIGVDSGGEGNLRLPEVEAILCSHTIEDGRKDWKAGMS